jgi:hypothetical protein
VYVRVLLLSVHYVCGKCVWVQVGVVVFVCESESKRVSERVCVCDREGEREREREREGLSSDWQPSAVNQSMSYCISPSTLYLA